MAKEIPLKEEFIEEGAKVLNVKKSYHEPATETTPEIPERGENRVDLLYLEPNGKYTVRESGNLKEVLNNVYNKQTTRTTTYS